MMLYRRVCPLAIVLPCLAAQAPQDAPRLARWRADLDAFAARLEQNHPAPFARLPRAEFLARLRSLREALPGLMDHEVAARWAALVAALGEEHSEVDFRPELEALTLPFEIATFADGTFIVAVAAPYRHLLGARLDRVEGRDLASLYEALKTYVPFSQEGRYRYVFDASFPAWPCLMDAAGLVKTAPAWTIEGLKADGMPFRAALPLTPRAQRAPRAWVRERPEERLGYRFQALQSRGTLLLRIASFEPDPGRPFGAFLRRALAAFRRRGLSRVVVDLRGNTGGKEFHVEQLMAALMKERRLGPGRLFALVDGHVFSAAAVAAWRLRHDAGAALIGAPCGAPANHIGSVDEIALPSGRIFSYGAEIHVIDPSRPEDFSSPILPDIAVPSRHADWARGRDPVLESLRVH